jgi:membrane protein implicated in regulation of membrane protease activity
MPIMEWSFYLILAGVLFALIVAVVALRYFIDRRLAAHEANKRTEEEARKTAESNSGL